MHQSSAKPKTRTAWMKQGVQTARAALHALRQRIPAPLRSVLRRTTHWTLHSMLGVVITVVLIFVAAHLWLPTLADRKGEIESYVSATLGQPVTLGELNTYWDGLNPGVRVQQLSVHAAATGAQVIRLKEMRLSLSWLALLIGRIEINSLVLVEPSLTVERQADGRFRIGGIEVAAAVDSEHTDLSRLLRSQKEIIIENGELTWLDRLRETDKSRAANTTPGKAQVDRAGGLRTRTKPGVSAEAEIFSVRGVYLDLRTNGDRHRLDLRADFPPGLCADCRISADLRGNPARDPSWRGEIMVQARALNPSGLPRRLREALPSGLAGHFDLRLTSQWRDERPVAIEGRIAVSGLSLPLPGDARPLAIRALAANLKWKGDAESWRLDLNSLRLGLTQPAWLAGRLRMDVRPERLRFDVEHVDVADLAVFTAALPQQHPLLDWLRAARPAGSLNRLRLDLAGPAKAPTGYSAEGELRDILFAAHERVPGVQGLSGQFSLSQDSGEFRLDSGETRIALPRLLKEPLSVQSLSSRVQWRKNSDDWFVQAQDIVLNARDGRVRGDFELRWPHDETLSPVLKTRLDFRDGDGRHTARYIPLILPEGLRAWIARAVIAGRVTHGHVVYHGALRNFPFRDGKGRFEVRAHVEDGVLEYLPDWAPIRNIDADLFFTGTNMLITATHGRIRNLDAGRVVVAIDDFAAPGGAVITAKARVTGALQETLGVLADSKTPRFVALAPAGMRAEGNGTLALDLRIPASAPQKSGIAGSYLFLNNNLEFPFRAIRAEHVRGAMEFNEIGVRAGKLNARLLGGETVFEALPGATPASEALIEARGIITQTGFAQIFGPILSPHLIGEAPWQARLNPGPSGATLHFESDLSGLEISLPVPLAKAKGEPLKLAMDSNPVGNGLHVLDVRAGKRVSGKLAFRHAATGWAFSRGRIGIGETVALLPAQAGLHLSARLPALDTDRWWPLLRQNLNDGNTSGWLDVVNRVSAEIDALESFGRGFGYLGLDIGKTAGNWQGRARGDSIFGEIAITQAPASSLPLVVGNVAAPGRPVIHLKLEKLLLPAARSADAAAPLDPRQLPPLHVQSQSFLFAGLDLGELEFSALPATHGWKITSLKLTRPESSLTASGLWQIDNRAQPTTRLDATLTSTDFGKLMDALGYREEVAGGKLTAQSNWSWPGPPGAFSLARTDGDLTFTLRNGRIPKISPGAGRLLGALDLQSITRYLTLDFSNLFSKGLTFDKMQGRVAVEQGNAYTRDLAIRAPGTSLDLSGRVGLAVRDLDLEIGVTPHLMEELALTGGLIGGPIVGAAVVVLHALIKKPFEKSTRIEYTVKGGWDDPIVARITSPEAASEEQK